jgi:hypothetical protein
MWLMRRYAEWVVAIGWRGHMKLLTSTETAMPIVTLPNENLSYYLIAFDADGHERMDDPDGLMSHRVIDAINDKHNPVTDIFIVSHGLPAQPVDATQALNLSAGASWLTACIGALIIVPSHPTNTTKVVYQS